MGYIEKIEGEKKTTLNLHLIFNGRKFCLAFVESEIDIRRCALSNSSDRHWTFDLFVGIDKPNQCNNIELYCSSSISLSAFVYSRW